MDKKEYLRKFFDENPTASKEEAQSYLNTSREKGITFNSDTPSFNELFTTNTVDVGTRLLNEANTTLEKKNASISIVKNQISLNAQAMNIRTGQPDYGAKPITESMIGETLKPYEENNENFYEQVDKTIREDLNYFNEDGTVDYNKPIDYDFYHNMISKEFTDLQAYQNSRVVNEDELPEQHFGSYEKIDRRTPFARYLLEELNSDAKIMIDNELVKVSDLYKETNGNFKYINPKDPVFNKKTISGLEMLGRTVGQIITGGVQNVAGAGRNIEQDSFFIRDKKQTIGRLNQDGTIQEGSVGLVDATAFANITLDMNRRYYSSLLVGNFDEANTIFNKYKYITEKYSAGLSNEGKNVFYRIYKEFITSGAPMLGIALESLAVGAGVGAITKNPIAASAAGRVTTVLAWQQQGAGQLLMNLYLDTPIEQYSQKERKKHLALSSSIGTLYSLVEQAAAAIPFFKSQGNMFSRKLATSLMRRALIDPTLKKTLARAGLQGGITYFTELGEEGVQELLLDLGFELGSKDGEVVASELFKSFKDGAYEARYGVAGFGVINTFAEYRATTVDIKNVDNNIKALKSAGYSENESKEIAIERVGGGKLTTKKQDREQAVIKIQAADLINNRVTNNRTEAETLSKKLIDSNFSRDVNIDVRVTALKNQINELKSQSLNPNESLKVSEEELKRVSELAVDGKPQEASNLLASIHRNIQVENLILQGINRRVASRIVMHASTGTKEGLSKASESLRNEFEKQSLDGVSESEKWIYDSVFGSITNTQLKRMQKQLKNNATREAIISNNNMDSKSAKLFRKALETGKEADLARYNAHVSQLRDSIYERFLFDNNLDAFTSASDLDSFPKHYENSILNGDVDDRVRKLYEDRGEKVTDEFIETEGRQRYLLLMKKIYMQEQLVKNAEQKDKNKELRRLDLVRRKRIKTFTKKCLESIKKLLPEQKIILHSSSQKYAEATGDNSTLGVFRQVDTQNDLINVIHINEEEADFNTVIHEVFHALFGKVISLDGNLENSLEETVNLIKMNLKPSLRKKLENIMEYYKNDSYYQEEYLAQILEILTQEYHTFSGQAKRAIRNIIDRILEFIGAGNYKKEFYDFGFTKDFTHLTKEELKLKAKLLGVKGFNRLSRENLLKAIGNNRSVEELKVITAMQTLSVKLYEGISINEKDINFLRVDPKERRPNLIKSIKNLLVNSDVDYSKFNNKITVTFPTEKKPVITINDKKLTELKTVELVSILEDIYVSQVKKQKDLSLPNVTDSEFEGRVDRADLFYDEVKQKTVKTIEPPNELTTKIMDDFLVRFGNSVVVSDSTRTDEMDSPQLPYYRYNQALTRLSKEQPDVKPLILFHGTGLPFGKLDAQTENDYRNDVGMHFGGYSVARQFAERAGTLEKSQPRRMYAAMLKIEKPLYFTNWNQPVPTIRQWFEAVEKNLEVDFSSNKYEQINRRKEFYNEFKKVFKKLLNNYYLDSSNLVTLIDASPSSEQTEIQELITRLDSKPTETTATSEIEFLTESKDSVLNIYETFENSDILQDPNNWIKHHAIEMAIKKAGYDGVIYKNQSDTVPYKETKISTQNYIVFNKEQIIEIYNPYEQTAEQGALEKFGVVKHAKKIPSSDFENSIDALEETLMDLESFYDIDLELPDTLLANRVERSQRNLRDFEYLAESLPDYMQYQVINRDNEEIIYMSFTKKPKASDFKDIKDVADRSSMKIIIEDRPVLPRGYIRSRGNIEYKPVRGRHIETLTFNELRTYAKELGINTSDIDFTHLNLIEEGYKKINVSPVMYKKFLFDETLDKRHGVNRSETDRAKLLARLEDILSSEDIDIKDARIANLQELYLTAMYPTDVKSNQKPRKWSGQLRPAQRTAIQRSGVVPEVGQEHYETIIAYNRLRFLNTRQELINRINVQGTPFIPRKVIGQKASKKEITKIEQEIQKLENNTKTQKAWQSSSDLEKNAIIRNRMFKSVLNEIADLSNLNVGYRALADVLSPSGSTTFTETYKIGKQVLFDDNGNEKQGEDIYAVSTGARVYYFTSFQVPFHGNRKIRVYFRTDETGSITINPMTGQQVEVETMLQVVKSNVDNSWNQIRVPLNADFVENNALGFSVEEAKRHIQLVNMRQRSERIPILEIEKLVTEKLGGKKRPIDDFGVSKLTKVALINLAEDLGLTINLPQKLGRIGDKIETILKETPAESLRQIIREHLKGVRDEAYSFHNEMEEYRRILQDDYNINPDSDEGKRLLSPRGLEEMKVMANKVVEQEAKEDAELDMTDYDEFQEFVNRIDDMKQERQEQGREAGGLTEAVITPVYNAYIGEQIGTSDNEPSVQEQLTFRELLERIRTTMNMDKIREDSTNLVNSILANVEAGGQPHLYNGLLDLAIMKIRLSYLESQIDGINSEISNLHDMIEVGGGGNYLLIEEKARNLKVLQQEMSRLISAQKHVSSFWGKQGVAMRMSSSIDKEFDINLNDVILEALNNYNRGKEDNPNTILPKEILSKINDFVAMIKKVDNKIDEVTERRNSSINERIKMEAGKWVTSKIKLMGGKSKFISKFIPIEEYFTTDELNSIFNNEENRLIELKNRILNKLEKLTPENFTRENAPNEKAKKDRTFYDVLMDLMKFHIITSDVKNLEDLIPLIKNDYPMLSDIDIATVLSNRSPSRIKSTKSESKKIEDKIKKMARLTEQIQDAMDIINGKKPVEGKNLSDIADEEVKSLQKLLRLYKNIIPTTIQDNEKAEQLLERVERIKNGVENAVRVNTTNKIKSESLQFAQEALRDITSLVNIEEEIKKLNDLKNEQDTDKFISRAEAIFNITSKDKTEKSKELKEALLERKELRNQLQKELDSLKFKNKTWLARYGSYAWEVVGIPRALMATADFSYFLRQGLMGLFWNPISNEKYGMSGTKIALNAMKQAYQAMFDPAQAALIDAGLRAHPMFNYITGELGLAITRYDGVPTQREERFMNNLINKELNIGKVDINIVGKVTRASERHMVTGLNVLRFRIMEEFLNNQMGKSASIEGKQAMARYINSMTGRQGFKGKLLGSPIDLEKGGILAQLSQITFSPRFAASRIMLPVSAISKSFRHKELAPAIIGQWLSYASFGMAIYALAFLGADEEDREKMSPEHFFNPFSPYFGYISVGDYKLDIWGGNMQPFRLGSRLLLSAFNTGFDGEKNFWDLNSDANYELNKFLWNKGSPQLRLAYELAFKKDPAYKRQIDWTEEWDEKALNYFTPFTSQLIAETAKDAVNDELSLGMAAALPAMESHGIGINKWDVSGRRRNNKRKTNPYNL